MLLDRIAAHTLNHSAPASALLISSAALASCSHLQFTINGFIEMARGAAGKAGTIASLNSSREALSQVLNRNIQAARNIFVHAAMLGCLTDRFTHEYVPGVCGMELSDVKVHLWRPSGPSTRL